MAPSIDLTREVIAICRIFAALEKEHVCGGGVSVAQCVVLQTLLSGSSEAAVLAEEHAVTRGAMTRLLDGLEKKQWIARTPNPDDRRRITIGLTPAGQKEATRLKALTESSMQKVLDQIPASERGQVARSVQLVRRALQSASGLLGCD